jgi:uncharacterized protein (TIGR01777 family)
MGDTEVNVVVAGGSGLIGRALVERLRADGSAVTVLSRRPGPGRVTWDGRTPGPWTETLADADAIVNLCGASVGARPWTPGRRRELRDSRLDPTRALVQALASLPTERRPRVLVNASGTDVYEGQDAVPATESTPPSGTFLARLTLDWEAEAARARTLGLRVAFARFSMVVGPGALAIRLQALPARLGFGGRIGSGRQWVSWIDLVDAVGIVELLLRDRTIDGPVNVCAPVPVAQAEVSAALARVVGCPISLPVPAWPVRLAMGEQSTLLLGSRRMHPERAITAGYTFRELDVERSLRRSLGR